MQLPILPSTKRNIEVLNHFLGYHHNLSLRRGEFYDMENLTSEQFPVLSPRKPRRILMENTNIQGLAHRDGLCYVEGEHLFLNGKQLDLKLSALPEDNPKQMISMGAYLIILPDKKYVNTADPQDWGSMDQENTTGGPVLLTQCSLDGSEIRPSYAGPEAPEHPRDGSWWLDFDRGELKQYAEITGLWAVLETPYVKIACPGIGRGFSEYDGVTLSGDPGLRELEGAAVLHGCGDDFLIVPGLLREKTTLNLPVTVSRKSPVMDFCLESGNRLWGCRYGPNRDGKIVNEIYCSKLGDFKNFSCFLGISTDSYAVSLGSEGPFTGAIAYGGYPLFFKENCLHKVFGTMPSTFQVQTTACRGVGPGCSRSLAICNEVLYYRSRGAVCAYDGSLPREISEALGSTEYGDAVAGAGKGRYYLSMKKGEGRELLVYDTRLGLWHKEDDLSVRLFCSLGQELICADEKGRLFSLNGDQGKEEGPVSWMAETGILGMYLPGNKYLTKLSLRMLLHPGSRVTVKIQYDSAGPFEILGTVQGMKLKSFVFPVLPRRCDHFRLRIEGEGEGMILSAARVLRPGSDAGD